MTQEHTAIEVTPELEGCPFCGSDAHLIPTATPGPILWQVQCEHCAAMTAKFAGEAKAVDAWNARAALAAPATADDAGPSSDAVREAIRTIDNEIERVTNTGPAATLDLVRIPLEVAAVCRVAIATPPPAGQTGVDEGLVEAEERTVEELSELLWDWRKKCGDNPLHPNHYLNAARTMLAKLNLSRSPVAEGEEGR